MSTRNAIDQQHPQPPPTSRLVAYGWLDVVMAVFALILAVASGYVLWHDIYLFTDLPRMSRGGDKPIASLAAKTNTVRRKAGEAPIWAKTETNAALFAQDQIFTDEQATAEVAFVGGTRVNLNPNTLIVVEPAQETPVVKVVKGAVRTAFTNANSVLTFRFNGKDTKVSAAPNTEMEITLGRDGQADLMVVKGEARLHHGTRTLPIREQEYRRLDRDGKASAEMRVPVKLVSPRQDQDALLTPGYRQNFAWQLDPGARVLAFELSADANFSQILHRQNAVAGSSLSLPLDRAGAYYWRLRVIGKDQREQWSEQRRGRLLPPEPPRLLWPLAGSQHRANAVTLRWFDASPAPSYTVIVAKDQAFAQPWLRQRVTLTSLSVEALSPGTYYWRVEKTLAGKTLAAMQSFVVLPLLAEKSQEPSVEAKPLALPAHTSQPPPSDPVPSPASPSPGLAPPQLSPGYDIRLPDAAPTGAMHEGRRPASRLWSWFVPQAFAEDRTASSPRIAWPNVTGARGYVLEIARDQSFASVIKRQQVERAEWELTDLDPGSYFLRVAAIDASGVTGPFSAPAPLRVQAGRMKTLEPVTASRLQSKPEDKQLRFRWRTPMRVKQSRFTLARDAMMRDVIHREQCACSSLSLAVPVTGTYYWRVTGIYANGAETPSSSPAVFFWQAPPPPLPPSTPAVTKQKETPPTMSLSPSMPLPPKAPSPPPSAPKVLAQPKPTPMPAAPLVQTPAPAPTASSSNHTPPAPASYPTLAARSLPPAAMTVEEPYYALVALSPTALRYDGGQNGIGVRAMAFNSYALQLASPFSAPWRFDLRASRLATMLFRDDQNNGRHQVQRLAQFSTADLSGEASVFGKDWDWRLRLGIHYDQAPELKMGEDVQIRTRGTAGLVTGVAVHGRLGQRTNIVFVLDRISATQRAGFALQDKLRGETALMRHDGKGGLAYGLGVQHQDSRYRGEHGRPHVTQTALSLYMGFGF